MIPNNMILTRSTSFVPLEYTWNMVDALYGGTQTMREMGTRYLPKAEAEQDKDYEARLCSSVLFNYYKQAVVDTTDAIFAEGIIANNVTPTLEIFLDDVNAKGDTVDIFMKEACKSAIHYGVSYVLTDYSRSDGNLPSEWDRPYWSLVEAPNMIALESKMIRGVETITHLRFQEYTTRSFEQSIADPEIGVQFNYEYNQTMVNQVRAYYLDYTDSNPANHKVFYQIYQNTEEKGWIIIAEGIQEGITRIPVVPIYGNKVGYYLGSPVYKDLAELNIRHWQSYSDQSNLLHFARYPILFANGIEDRDSTGKPVDILIGANTVLKTANPNADLKFVEHDGKAVDSGWKDIEYLINGMTLFGPSLTADRGNATATEWILKAGSLNANLKAMGDSFANSLDHLMAFTLPYLTETQFPDFEIEPRLLDIGTPASNVVNTVADTGTGAIADAAAASANLNNQ